MLQLIDDETASRYYNEIDTATGDDLQTKISALESWATAKKAEQHRQQWDHVSGVFTDFDNYSASEGLDAFDEESRYQYANRQFIAHQTGGKFEDQMFVYPSKRDEVTDLMFGKTGLSEKETFNLIKGAVESRKASEEALRELPGVLAQGILKSAGEGKPFDEVDSWFAFDGWKQRHADKLGAMPAGWETAMLDSAVKLHARTEALMADVAPESKRAMDVLMKFTRPEDAESLPDADRADVENLAKDFAKLTPEQRDGIYATLSYAAEAGGAGLGKGFWEKVGEGIARGGVNIYDDAAMTAEDRETRKNISFFQDLLDKPQAEPDRMQTAESIQMQRDMAQDGLDKNKERLGELRVMREIRDLAQGRIDPIKTEMDGVLGQVVQGAYDFSQSAAYTGMAMIPYVGLPAVMGALANSNYLRMLDEYPDMDADAAYNLSLAIAGPQAVIERIQGGLLLGKLPYLNQAMKRLTDVRVPLPARLGLGYAGVVGAETVTELAQEAMPVVADQIAAAVREDMPEFDSEKAWGQYWEQAPKIFYSMLWGGLIGGGAVGIRELDRSGVFLRNVQELEMHGITGEAAQNIAAEQDPDAATTLFREAWDKRTPEDIQAGISKRAAMIDAAQATQANPDLPTRRVEQAPDGTTTHIIEQNGQTIYSTNDPAAADLALVNFTRMVDRGRITGTTNGIVEALSFFNQVNEAANRGDDVQKFILENTPRTLLDEYEANPNEQNLDNLFKTVRTIGQDISEPAELANFPVLASNQGALAEGIFKSVIRIYEGATGDKVVRDVAQDNLKRAIAEQRITMDWVRENLNQIIPQIESERITQKLRTETDTDVIESFSDVALAYMRGNIRDEQIPAGFRGFLRRMAIVVKDIFRRAYKLKRLVAEGKVDANFEALLAESVGLNQQTLVDTTRERVGNEVLTDTNYSIGSPAFQNWFADSKATDAEGKPMVVYHGTQRPDRVGSRFRKTRATSGPMAFFTNDPAIASSYATGKKDTSMEMPSDYAGWFKWKGKGMRSPVNIDQAWWNLSEAERATIKERIYTVGYSDADEASGPIVSDSQSIMSRDSIDYELRQARGNALRALVEMWLSSGSLFNQEEKFLEVLQAAGVKGATLDDPNAARSAVYPVYLSIKNPLDTASIPENVVAALEQASRGKRAKRAIGGNPDAWDKNTVSGKDWVAALKEDIANGTTYAWTRIPDWATQTLSSLGYDGIKDTGGKRGGTAHQVWIPFNETQIKSATGNRGTFDPTSPNINYSIGIRFDEIAKEDPKHDGSRVGTAWQGKVKPTTQDTNDGIASVVPEELEKQMAMLTHFVDGVPLPKFITKHTNPKKRMLAFIEFQKGNLLALYDAFEALSADYVIRSTHWYDGARLLAEGIRDLYGLTIEQSSSIIAVFSPMKDWFQNVAMGQRFADVMANHQKTKITKQEMSVAMEEMLNATEKEGDLRKELKEIEGKSIEQLLRDKSKVGRKRSAVAVRLMSTHVHGLSHDVLSPEGESLGIRKNKNGSNKKMVWQSYAFIEKAISIFENGSLENISKTLGTEHKIRNFYNNIVAPTSPYGDATVDTHAVNAAVLYPMGGSAYLTTLNFGDAGVAGGGNSGIYWLFHEALREASAERGVMPRQMQSITWEAIRGLFTDVRKRDKKFVAAITKIWENAKDAEAARSEIIGLGITPPEWARVDSSNSGFQGGVGEDAGQEADSAGSIRSGVRQGRQGGNRGAGVSNFSIASQSEIDRVNKALGGMNRGPDARIAVYERAKAKFSTLLQNNQQALDNLRAGTVSFRRTQLLQALGELDAILSIFPPDIRGRVGGYTRLASIAPHDVFKDGEKVSEVSGMNGAIISAWMREGLSIGPAGQQTELPPGYTAKENLGTARADRAIADFFKKRIEMIDRELEKTLRREYDEAFRKLLDRTKPKKAKPGEKPKGIGGDIQDLFAVVRDSVDMNATQVAAHIAGLDSMIASGDLTAEQEARAMVEAALVALTGDWKNADADRRRTAFMEASRIWNGAYATHAQKIIRQREEREIARAEAIIATGKAGELAGRKSKAIADSGLKGSWKDYILNLLNFDQVVGVLFGENTEVANTIIDKQRRAENAKEDGSQAKMQELEDFFTGLAGGNVLDGERLRYRLTQPSMTVKGIEMSELEALSAVMMWVQEDGRRHMEGEMDEAGRPVGKWHYNQDFVDEILANLSEEALALRSWLTRNYANEYAKINEVYSELNGVNLPQIQLYSPVTVQPVNAPTGQVLDPVSGSAMSGASTSPGALRTRGTAIAEPRFQDVLQTYISHTLQMEHWKAFAPMIAEANGILRNRDVQNSVEEKGGVEARKMLNAWLDYFAQGGTRDAGAHLALNQGLNNVLGRASQVALVGRASTLLIQSTQLGAALAEMPVKAYLKRMGKLLTGQLGWDSALNSDYIQRRVKQMPPVVQLAMQGLKGARPTAIQQAGKRLGMLLSGADGLFTAGTYAITYDYHLTKAKELGLAGQEAEDYARNTAERVTDRIAQPTRAGARSLYENTSTNPLARAGWAFASEARKNLALVAYSFAERDTATKMRTLAYVVALNAIGSAILRSIWRDILDDEDDELFDDKYWSPKRIATAIATEPLYGFPVLGSVVQEAVYKSFGEYKPSESLFSVQNAIGPIKRLPDHLSGDTDLREVMRDIDMVVSALGIMHPNIAAAASITHLAKDLFNLTDSTVDAVTEN